MEKGCFQVYRSSAGSGKTYTLVKEYLKLVLLQPEKMSQILAVTFTNAAAAEMKSRIINELYGLSSLDKNPALQNKSRELLDRICEDFRKQGITPPAEKQIIGNAQTVLNKILHNYSDFSIGTIDSFVHRVVRTFAFDLGVPVRFETELESANLLSKAVNLLISRAGTDQQLTAFLLNYLLREASDEKSLAIERHIADLAKTLFDETSGPFVERLNRITIDQFHQIQISLAEQTKTFEQNAQRKALEAISLINDRLIDPDAFYQKGKGIYGYLLALSQGKVQEKIVPGSYVRETMKKGKWYSPNSSQEVKEAIDPIKTGLTRLYLDIVGEANGSLIQYLSLKAVNRHIFSVGVLNEVKKILDQIKFEHSLLHISDFNRKISDIIAEQPVPFIYEMLGERYQHYMIDEFQDTSVLQWQNLLPLVENGLATGQVSLVVGDGKQAIYRWRDGDVEQFVALPSLPEKMPALGRLTWQNTLTRNFKLEHLNKNFRSKKEVVLFNNSFFNYASQFLGDHFKDIYREVAQEPGANAQGGYVEIAFLEKSDQVPAGDQMVQRVGQIIGRLREAGHPFQDIAILCRSNLEATRVAGHLLQQEIPVITSESLLLSKSPEVIFIVSLLKLLHNRHDSIAGLEAMGFLINSGKVQHPEGLHQGLSGAGFFVSETGKELPCWHRIIDNLMENNGIDFRLRDAATLGFTEICPTIVNAFFTNGPPNPFVAFFLDTVYEYSGKNPLTIMDFLQWWVSQSKTSSLVVPEGIPAVRIMTIHKAKGLEFPVVIFPFASLDKNKPSKDGCWVSPPAYGLENLEAAWISYARSHLENTLFLTLYEEEMQRSFLDKLNLAYVAFTRPREKLFVICKEPDEKQKEYPSLSQMLQGFLATLPGFRAEEPLYSFGQFEQVQSAGAAKPQEMTVFTRLHQRNRAGALKIRANVPDRSGALALQRDRGKVLHKAMERIKTVADIKPTLDGLLSQGAIDQKTGRDWMASLTDLLTSEPLLPYFREGVKALTEPGVFDQSGNLYRPDRVVLLENQTVVIDYKTGAEHPGHSDQIEQYAQLLHEMGYPNIRKILVYPDQQRLNIV